MICCLGSSFEIKDYYTKMYGNLHTAPKHLYSYSEILDIVFIEGQDTGSTKRLSAKEGFIVAYGIHAEGLSHLLDSYGTNFQGNFVIHVKCL
jgi:hypothetical protein